MKIKNATRTVSTIHKHLSLPFTLLVNATVTPSKPELTARSTLTSPAATTLARTRPGARSSTRATAGEPSARLLRI